MLSQATQIEDNEMCVHMNTHTHWHEDRREELLRRKAHWEREGDNVIMGIWLKYIMYGLNFGKINKIIKK